MLNRSVFVAWRSGGDSTGHWGPVGRLSRIETGFQFDYTRGAELLKGFQPFSGMENLRVNYQSENLFPLFKNRLLDRKRSEYPTYLGWAGFSDVEDPDPIALLGVTEGLRATDQLEIFPAPAPDAEGCYSMKFFLHGIRWTHAAAQERLLGLAPGERLGLMLDINNPRDESAVAVRTTDDSANLLLGYVPRYLAQDIRGLSLRCEPSANELSVERINLDAPVPFRLLCRYRACWPAGFAPCQTEMYLPIANGE